MLPDYALILSYQGIRLVERSDPAGDWHLIGTVALDAPDLPGAIAALKQQAEARAGRPIVVRLVLPNEQIRYMVLPREESGIDAVRAALDGATPYAVDDLVFDFDTDASGTHVAAVARETLDEASAFATEHGLVPLCYTAIPAEASFAREVFFGLAPGAETTVPPGTFVGPDDRPLTISDAPPADPARPAAPPPEDAAPVPEPAAELPPSKPRLNLAQGPATPPGDAQHARTKPAFPGPAPAPEAASPAATARPAAEPLFASRSRKTVEPDAARPARPQGRPPVFVHRAPTPDVDAPDTAKPDLSPRAAPKPATPDVAARPKPPFTVPTRTAPPPAPVKTAGPFSTAVSSGLHPGAAAFEVKAAASVSPVTADPDPVLSAATARPSPSQLPMRAIGISLGFVFLLACLGIAYSFGAFDGTPQAAGTTPEQPLVSPEIESQLAQLPGSEPVAPVAQAPAPVAVTGTILSEEESQRRYAATGVWQRAPGAPEPGRASESAPDTPSALPQTARAATPAVAPPPTPDATQPTPAPPPPPGAVFALDENGFIAATPDGVLTPQGAFVILGRPELSPPARPGTQAPVAAPTPAPAEAEQPQPAPNGVVVVPGPPAISPPSRPAGLAPQAATRPEATTDEAANTAPAPADPPVPDAAAATAGEATSPEAPADTTASPAEPLDLILGPPPVSPPARPGTVAPPPQPAPPEQTGALPSQGGVSLAGLDPAAAPVAVLAGLRPRPRPAGIAPPAEAAAAAPATPPFANSSELAVATALRPDPRPGDIARLVAVARAAQPSQVAQPTPVSAATISTIAPTGAVNGTVAARATQEGALPLNRTALIGVFGSSSNRRALVRLTSGQLVRVTVGDSLDGGRVASIGTSELLYTRGGRSIRLSMP